MKKSLIIFSALFLTIVSISLAMAALPGPPEAFNGMFNFLKDMFTESSYDQALARFLIFMTVTIVLYMPSYIMTGRKSPTLGMVLAAIVSYLGVRFLTNEAIIGLFLPSAALAVTIMTAIPFFLFSGTLSYYVTSKPIRKTGWLLMVCAFVGLWVSRFPSIGEVAYVYALFSIASLVMFLFDGTIRAMFIQAKVRKGTVTHAWVGMADIQTRLNSLIEKSVQPGLTKEMKESIAGELADLRDEMKNLSKEAAQ
jgi:hypothetical protein